MKIQPNSSQAIQNRPSTTESASSASSARRSKPMEMGRVDQAGVVDPGAAKTEISGKAKELAHAKDVASQTPDIREQKIAEIKARIAAGKYEVNSKAIADRMVDEHLTSSIG